MLRIKKLSNSKLDTLVEKITKHKQQTVRLGFVIDTPFFRIDFTESVKLVNVGWEKPNTQVFTVIVGDSGLVKVEIDGYFQANADVNTLEVYSLDYSSDVEEIPLLEVDK